jgi:hypothetical protein
MKCSAGRFSRVQSNEKYALDAASSLEFSTTNNSIIVTTIDRTDSLMKHAVFRRLSPPTFRTICAYYK